MSADMPRASVHAAIKDASSPRQATQSSWLTPHRQALPAAALGNMAFAGVEAAAVVGAGAVPALVALLPSGGDEAEAAAWATSGRWTWRLRWSGWCVWWGCGRGGACAAERGRGCGWRCGLDRAGAGDRRARGG